MVEPASGATLDVALQDGMLMGDTLVEIYIDYTSLSAEEFGSIVRAIDRLHELVCSSVERDREWMPHLYVAHLSSSSSRVVFRQGVRLFKLEYPQEQLTVVLPRWAAVPYLLVKFTVYGLGGVAGALTIQEYLAKHPPAQHQHVIDRDFNEGRLSDAEDPIGRGMRDAMALLRETLTHDNILRFELNGVPIIYREKEDTGENRRRPPSIS
jgi:hypothetical protein